MRQWGRFVPLLLHKSAHYTSVDVVEKGQEIFGSEVDQKNKLKIAPIL
jgi:hypothetical protein